MIKVVFTGCLTISPTDFTSDFTLLRANSAPLPRVFLMSSLAYFGLNWPIIRFAFIEEYEEGARLGSCRVHEVIKLIRISRFRIFFIIGIYSVLIWVLVSFEVLMGKLSLDSTKKREGITRVPSSLFRIICESIFSLVLFVLFPCLFDLGVPHTLSVGSSPAITLR